MTLKSGYISVPKIKRNLAVISCSTIYEDYHPGLCRLARDTLTYIIRLERKVMEYEEKANKS